MRNIFVEMEKLKNPYSGLGQFCLHLGKALQQFPSLNSVLNFYTPSAKKNVFGTNFNYIAQKPIHKFFHFNTAQYDVWHCIHQDSKYLPENKKTKLILTIHDLNFLEKYKGVKQKIKLKKLQNKLDRASAITVISHYTKQQVQENLKINIPIHVIYNGNSLVKSSCNPTIVIDDFKEYFFSIGIVNEKKNFHVLLPLLESFPKMHLVIAGNNKTAYAQYILSLAKEKGILNRVHLVGNIDDCDKYHLYENCKAFVFPSLTEGFGLPVVEAMSLGKPVFISALSSLPEIGGEEAYYWNDFSPVNMANVVKDGLKDYENSPTKREQIIRWSQQFSWEEAAKSYLKLYESV